MVPAKKHEWTVNGHRSPYERGPWRAVCVHCGAEAIGDYGLYGPIYQAWDDSPASKPCPAEVQRRAAEIAEVLRDPRAGGFVVGGVSKEEVRSLERAASELLGRRVKATWVPGGVLFVEAIQEAQS